jgi:asparagine synthase (glutamine-hydrolysing)
MAGLPERMAEWFDEPFSNDSAVPTYRVSAFAREQVTVALSGDGGDELFGGYTWYDSYARIRHLQRWWPLKVESGLRMPPVPRRRAFELMTIADPVALYARVRGSLPAHRLEQWRRRLGIGHDYDPYWAYRQHFHRGLPDRKAAQILDFHTYLPNVMLTKVDRMSMAVSLECRPPFLSQQLIEFAFRLPQSFVYRGGRLKGGLKHAIRDLVPRSVLERDKQGFSVPDSGWRRRLVSEHGSIQEAIVSRFIESS